MAALEAALAAGYPFAAVKNDPDLQPLVKEPAFAQLAAKFQRT